MKRRKPPFDLAAIAAIFAVHLLNATSDAANVVWEPAHNITQITDVLTTGELVGAFNIGAAGVPSTTVNGVIFSPLEVPNDFSTGNIVIGNFTFSGGARTSNNTSYGSASAPFITLAASAPSYGTLLQSASAGMSGQSLGISGLIIDREYFFQIWTNQSGLGSPGTLTVASGASQLTLDINTSDALGGLGQFAVGRFVANSSFQSFEFQGTGQPVNAFQLRMGSVVPEPSTLGIFALGSAVLIYRRKRRSQ